MMTPWRRPPTTASPLPPPVPALIEAPDAPSGAVGGMSSLSIRAVDRDPFFSGSVEGGVGRSKYEPGRCVKGPDVHPESVTVLSVAHLALSAKLRLAGEAP
ncbi:hypothetical protein AB0L00_33505 [Actinoallomurus sp. NPDC052308]|uniref:hypothetical protein n=1 Tax=Actinoallomurus sp. NPDC052308 TaxID=3155530 RepID=UPI00341C71D6